MPDTKKRKTAIITGYNRGIGESVTLRLAQDGYDLILCSRSKNNEIIDNVKKKFKIQVRDYNFNLKDIDNTISSAKEIIKDCNQLNQGVNLLVNNAGMIKTGLFLMEKKENFKEIFDVNFFSQVFFTQSLINLLKKNKGSSIINISSTSALEHDLGRLAYNASKSAFISFSKTLSKELSMFGIRVNCIAPGLINTEMLTSFTSQKVINEMIEKNISKRLGTKEEIAELVSFLASDKSNYINGQTLRIDGGMF